MKVTCEIGGSSVQMILAHHANLRLPGDTQFYYSDVKVKLHPIRWRRKYPKACPIASVVLTKTA